MRGRPSPVVDAITVPATAPDTSDRLTDDAPLAFQVSDTAFFGSPPLRISCTTNRKMNAQSAMIPARISAVSTPRGIRGFWVNRAVSLRAIVGAVADTCSMRAGVCPNHGRGPFAYSSAVAVRPGWMYTVDGSAMHSMARVGSRPLIAYSVAMLPVFVISTSISQSLPPTITLGRRMIVAASTGSTVRSTTWSEVRVASTVEVTRTMSFESPAGQVVGTSNCSVSRPTVSGNNVTTGGFMRTHAGSRPNTFAVTPSITSEVLTTSMSNVAGSAGMDQQALGRERRAHVRRSPRPPARARWPSGGIELHHDLVAGCGGDQEATGLVDDRAAAR